MTEGCDSRVSALLYIYLLTFTRLVAIQQNTEIMFFLTHITSGFLMFSEGTERGHWDVSVSDSMNYW